MDRDILLQTSGDRIVTGTGRPVLLHGIGLGGWMNMENFITGHPATETLTRAALRRALGDDGYDLFFDRFLDVFFADEDAALLAGLGLNLVRLPVNYRHFEDDMAPFELKEEGFRVLDRALERCARHGLYAIIDLHAAPGFQNQQWHSDNPTHWAFFWTHKHFQDRVVHLWQEIARRYRDNPWVAGFNALNEPNDPSGEVIGPFYRRLHDAVREIDPHHLFFFDANRYSHDFSIFDEVWPNTVYTVHDYHSPGFYWGGGYPGVTRGTYVDRREVERVFVERTEFVRRTGTPIYVGEFGPVYLGDEAADAQRRALLADQLDIYGQYGAGWAVWTYKDLGLQGLVNLAPESPYVERISGAVAKKHRLGADNWGSADNALSDVMDPIQRRFEAEFGQWEPFPLGAHVEWLHRLVRNITFAEPLVDDFEKCFQGLRDEATILALADSFALANCRVREPLADVLRHGAATAG